MGTEVERGDRVVLGGRPVRVAVHGRKRLGLNVHRVAVVTRRGAGLGVLARYGFVIHHGELVVAVPVRVAVMVVFAVVLVAFGGPHGSNVGVGTKVVTRRATAPV